MSDTVTLGEFDTELIYEAAIDGATSATGRHPPARRYAVINRVYKRLRSLVSATGEDFFRVSAAVAPIPARAAGEDWIELPWPTDATEIISVDVQRGNAWHELTHSSWAQRRVYPGQSRSSSPGEWATLSMPQPTTTSVTAGKIVIWPTALAGNFKVDYLPKWTPLTDPLHVFVMFPDWYEWALTAATLIIVQRDNDKRDTFLAARDRNAVAEAKIVAHTRRSRRGSVVARRRDGLEL